MKTLKYRVPVRLFAGLLTAAVCAAFLAAPVQAERVYYAGYGDSYHRDSCPPAKVTKGERVATALTAVALAVAAAKIAESHHHHHYRPCPPPPPCRDYRQPYYRYPVDYHHHHHGW